MTTEELRLRCIREHPAIDFRFQYAKWL